MEGINDSGGCKYKLTVFHLSELYIPPSSQLLNYSGHFESQVSLIQMLNSTLSYGTVVVLSGCLA